MSIPPQSLKRHFFKKVFYDGTKFFQQFCRGGGEGGGGEGGGHSKCMESFIGEFSPNMVKYSFED